MIDLSKEKFFSPYFATHACASAVFDSKMSITVRVASVFMTAISAFIETLSYIANGVRSATKWVFCCNSVNKEISKIVPFPDSKSPQPVMEDTQQPASNEAYDLLEDSTAPEDAYSEPPIPIKKSVQNPVNTASSTRGPLIPRQASYMPTAWR